MDILSAVRRLVQRKSRLDHRPMDYGTDYQLYNAEILMIEILEEYRQPSVTRLAEILGQSKAAVSQTLNKLESKKLIRKTPDPENRSRFLVSLTEAGQAAGLAHQKWHRDKDQDITVYLDGLSAENLDVIKEFLDRFNRFLD